MKKLAIVVGARPQFIKLSPVLEAFAGRVNLILIHTGQHYDFEMSDIFFNQLRLRRPDYHLGIGALTNAGQTGAMLAALDEVFRKEKPQMVIVTGDTNSTLAGALAAAQNRIPLAHIEAGLRAKDKFLPEQINRVLTDHLSNILCCPTRAALNNLEREGIREGAELTGDVLYDIIREYMPDEGQCQNVLDLFGLKPGHYIYLTAHRADNVDDPLFLKRLIDILAEFDIPVFFPVHPRTMKNIQANGLGANLENISNLIISKPIGIIESLAITQSSLGIITDSGGLQREAAYFGKKTYVLRDETEWVELENGGIVVCIGKDINRASFDWGGQFTLPIDYFKPAANDIAKLILESSLTA
jgi:UDP-N-acetylglucosamine 2-epimerase